MKNMEHNNKNDMKFAGSGVLAGGDYATVACSGSLSVQDTIRCEQFRVSGSARAHGSVICKGKVSCSGAFRCDGDVSGDEVRVSGSCHVDGTVTGNTISISGALKAVKGIRGGEIRLSGGISTEGDVEGDSVSISGGGTVGGMINGETVRLSLSRKNESLRVGVIGGTSIFVRCEEKNFGLFRNLFGKRTAPGILRGTVIEGDTVELIATECKTVRGRDVVIGEFCRIEKVEYTGTLTVDPSAEVKQREKVEA